MKSGPTLRDPIDCILAGSSVQEISQSRILEQVSISYSRGSSWSRDRTQVSCIGRQVFFFTTKPLGKLRRGYLEYQNCNLFIWSLQETYVFVRLFLICRAIFGPGKWGFNCAMSQTRKLFIPCGLVLLKNQQKHFYPERKSDTCLREASQVPPSQSQRLRILYLHCQRVLSRPALLSLTIDILSCLTSLPFLDLSGTVKLMK